MSEFQENESLGSIAIIGMNGRFPGAKNIDEFWENLKNGVESVKFFSREELIESGIDKHLLDNPKFVAADAILDNMDMFDASFFDYSAREAEIMDPQHRHFLECAWEVMESAGYDTKSYDGKIAIYGGSALSGYMIRNLYSNPGLVEDIGTFKIMIANSQDFLTTRVSYKLNLKGPSVNINTLCSSSLVAVHTACQNLLNYNCDLALAGGVSFQISRNESFFYQEGGIGASDGHCRAFDAKANGTVSGSGLGIVVLKRFEEAQADGDTIHAVIRGSAVNNDGIEKNSFTAPNVDGQAECIAEAISLSGVDPETISYIETHGTGTNLGDPIEVAGLTKVFRSYTEKKQFCSIGSVKTNIGHLVTAGGVASLIKTVEAMKHKMIPPSLNFETPNPNIDFKNSPFYVATKLTEWNNNGLPFRAGVSSFGIGGTNAHLVIEEAPKINPSGHSRSYQLICLSAKTATALDKMTANLHQYIKNHHVIVLPDVAYTLQVGRRNFNYRRMILCKDKIDFDNILLNKNSNQVMSQTQLPKNQDIVFGFSGNISIYQNIGNELYKIEKFFKNQVDNCCEILMPLLGYDLREILFSKNQDSISSKNNLNEQIFKQTTIFILQYSLAKLWMHWGIVPKYMFGQGISELVAACLANVFSLHDSLLIITSDKKSYNEIFSKITINNSDIPFSSNLTNTIVSNSDVNNRDYWIKVLSLQNTFKEDLPDIINDKDLIFIEMGSEILTDLIEKKIEVKNKPNTFSVFFDNQSDKPVIELLLRTLGCLWLLGINVNWKNFYSDQKRNRIPLPTYPFERQRYWITPGDITKIKESNNKTEKNNIKDKLIKKERPVLKTDYIAPRNEFEKKIADRWQNVLGFEKIGINDDFFELGGHSLMVAALANELKKDYGIEIKMQNFFELSTIAEVGELVSESLKNK